MTIFALQILTQQQVSDPLAVVKKNVCKNEALFLLLFKTELPYRVVIFPSKKHGPVTTTANVWVAISGSMAETQQVTIPRSSLEFVFHVNKFRISLNFLPNLRNIYILCSTRIWVF